MSTIHTVTRCDYYTDEMIASADFLQNATFTDIFIIIVKLYFIVFNHCNFQLFL